METPVGAPIKEKFRIEVTKLKEMPFGKKMEYIWEYYKLHIIGLLVIIILVGSLINTWFINPQPDAVLFISWNSGFATEEQFDELTSALEELLVDDAKNEEVIISRFLIVDGDPALEMAGVQRMVAMMAAGVIDAFVLESQLLSDYARNGFLYPLEDILETLQAENPIVYERISENIATAMYETEELGLLRKVVGVSIGSSPLFEELGFFEQELYFSISASSGNKENAVSALILLFE